MEKEQIIKALEYCAKGSCKGCPYDRPEEECIQASPFNTCIQELPFNALALIRELTADVERVSKQCAEIIIECDERDAIRLRQVGEYAAKVKELTEENERLRMEFDALDAECCRLERLEDEYHFSRPKAIQKMAERLKKRFPAIDPCIFDNIAEEILEEQ